MIRVLVDTNVVISALLFPNSGGEFGVEQVEVVEAPVGASPGQAGQFDLGDVEPGAGLGVWWIPRVAPPG